METDRLVLRQFMPGDLNDFMELIRDKMASELSVYDEQFPTDEKSLRDILLYFTQSEEFFAIQLKGGNRVIGFVSLNYVNHCTRNLGFCIHSSYQNRGYAGEAAAQIIEYAKNQLMLKKIVSGTAEQNIAAVRLLQKMGFELVSRQKTSFAKDAQGKPIVFIGCSFERAL